MRLIKNFANHKIAVVIVVVLLAVQAFCDLSLPNYTSDIVDVGIQQSGVEHASTDALTERTHDLVAIMESEQNESLFADSYFQCSDGTYELTDFGREHRAELDDAMSMPLVAVHYADQTGMDLDQLKAAYDAGMVQKPDVQTMLDEAKSQMGDMADSIVDQQAIAAAKAEYEQLGYDLNAMQMNYLLTTGGKMLGLAALGMVIAVIVGFIASRTAAKIGASLRSRLFERVLSFSDAEIQSFSAASLITRGTNDVQQVQMVSVMMLRMILYAPILAIGGIIMIARTNLSMGWIIVAAVLAIAVVMLFLMKVAMPKFKIMQKLIDRVNLVSREILTGIPVVRAFGREAHEEERFDEANLRLMKTQLFTNRVMTFMMPAMMLIMNGISVLIVWVGGSAIDAGSLQTGDLIAFITYSMVVIMSFLMLGMLAIIIPRADVSAQRIDEVLATEPSICDPSAPSADAITQAPAETDGVCIAFNHVDFKYSDSVENVLEDIDFVAEPGKTTAIIGSTGSGKSTILKLIERFYDVTGGSVTIDGIDVRDLSQHDLHAQLGYAPQHAFLFAGTIGSNIGYGAKDASDDALLQAADIAQATEFIETQDEGIDSFVTQGGGNVSGGQRQRLSIARALATDARAYLFDDSFSALDYKTDAALRRALHSRMGGKTVIIVAQRIATIMHADKIVVLDEGRVAGMGTHDQLMQSCDLYREIAYSQLSEKELAGGCVA